jgi:heat shock protein beta
MKFSKAAILAITTAAGAAAFVPASSSTARHASFGLTTPLQPTRRSSNSMPSRLFMSTAVEKSKETFEFTSDVGRVMDLIINSLYSDKDIFLRELISNAADACDKKRFLSLTSDGEEVAPPVIKIKADPDANTIIIEDTGVGMTREELINNLGRIAQSGTCEPNLLVQLSFCLPCTLLSHTHLSLPCMDYRHESLC